jgi:NADH-quinone oxidoreductase subunit J
MRAIFYISAAVTVVATVMVITRARAVHALLYLIASLLGVAVIFYTLGAPFVAALEVIIYAGAIMVLFVFVVMMLNLGPEAAAQERRWLTPATWVGPAVLGLVLLGELVCIFLQGGGRVYQPQPTSPHQVGVALFGPYLLGVELAALILLAGLVGAYHLGRHDTEGPESAGIEKGGG